MKIDKKTNIDNVNDSDLSSQAKKNNFVSSVKQDKAQQQFMQILNNDQEPEHNTNLLTKLDNETDETALNNEGTDSLSNIFSNFLNSNNTADKLQNHIENNDLSKPQTSDTNLDAKLQQDFESIVSKIYISDTHYTNSAQVRIIFSEQSFLSDSEVIVQRNLEGLLAVEINCKHNYQYKKLNENKQALIDLLEQKEQHRVLVNINEQNNADNSDTPL